MKLTAFTDYSLRVLIYVATAPEGRATIAEIAQAYGISEHHLVKVTHLLGREGFLVNTRGRGGGMRLAQPASAIGIGRVVRATEGPDVPVECFGDRNTCVISGSCRLARVIAEAMRAFHAVLDQYTLDDLVHNRATIVNILHHRAA